MANITFTHPARSQVIDGAMHYDYSPIDQSNASDVAHFVATYNRALRQIAHDEELSATIHLGERTQDKFYTDAEGNQQLSTRGGWLEHTIVIARTTRAGRDHVMTIGAIQREPGKASEFHS